MFVGSIHAGGSMFYASMYIMPPLYLLYVGMWPTENFFASLIPLLVLHYILWLLIMLVWLSIFRKENDTYE